MKMFNKVLAVILSLVMLLSVVPVAVFASNDGNTTIGSSPALRDPAEAPAGYGSYAGTGEDGTITLNLDANALLAAIKGEKSEAALLDLIQDVIDRTETDVLTKGDLMALVPKQALANAIVSTTDAATVVAVLGEAFNSMSESARNEIIYEVSTFRGEAGYEKFYNLITEIELTNEFNEALTQIVIDKFGNTPGESDLAFVESIMGENGIDYDKLLKNYALPAICEVVGYRSFLLGDDFAQFVDLDKLNSVDTIVDIIEEIGVVNTLKALKVLAENADQLLSKEQAKAVAMVLYFSLASNIDLVAVNGYAVIHNDGDETAAYMDAGEIVRAIKSLIPRLTEWAECEDGNIFSFNLVAKYQDANNPDNYIEKDINVQIVMEEGDLAVFRSFAKTLAQYITVYNKGTDLYIEITLPGVITRALASYLEDCTEGEEIKDEFLELAGKTGIELVQALENMTWDRILAVFASIDVERLYTYVTTLSQVEYVLEMIQNHIGLNYKLEDLQDINKIIHKIASEEGQAVLNKATLETIVAVLSDYIKVDIMAYLNKTTAIIDKTATVEILLAQMKAMPIIGDYIAAKVQSDTFSLTDFVEEYKNLGAADAMAAFVAKAFQKDFWTYMENNSANEIYDRIIAEVEERADIFSTVFDYMKSYAFVAAYIADELASEGLIPSLADKSFANTYRGNGKFELISKHFYDVDLGTGITGMLSGLLAGFGFNPDYAEYLNLIMPMDQLDNLDFGIHLTLNIPDISKVTFLKETEDGIFVEDTVMFMPNGINPGRFHGVAEGVSYWIDNSNNNIVTKVNGDVTLKPVSGLFTGGYLVVDGNNWTITSKSEDFDIIVNVSTEENRAAIASLDSLTFANIHGLKITMSKVVLADILAKTETQFVVSYDFNTECGKVESANGGYSFTPARVESFNLKLDGNAFEGNFAEAVDVTIPFAKALAANDLQRTNVYNVIDGKLSAEELDVVATKGASVVLNAKHFSDYVVVNEYRYTTKFFLDGAAYDGETDTAADGFVPAGATVKVIPKLAYRPGKKIVSISYNGNAIGLGAELTMPAAPVTIKCEIALLEGNLFYNVFGEIFTEDELDDAIAAIDAALAAGTLPKGYTVYKEAGAYKWEETNDANANVYMTPALKAITFEVKFPDNTTKTFTVETLNAFTAPAVTAKAGMIGYWACNNAELDPAAIINATEIKAITEKIELTTTAAYRAIKYTVYLPDGTVALVGCGEEYTYAAKAGMTAQYVIVSNDTENGKVAGTGKLVMPAYDVKVIEVAKEVTYTVNGTEFKGLCGTAGTFTVTLAKGASIVTAPNVGTVASFIVNKDGSKTVTYTFEVKENLAITYTVDTDGPATVQLVNGMTGKDTATSIKKLAFAGFSDATVFESARYQFALYQAEEAKANLLWLWILIALIVIIGLIALFYNLYIHEKLKPNFMLRGVTWIVSMFFNACLAVSSVVLMIAQGTTKKGEVDYQEFGMNNPEDLDNAENAEATETAEEVAEEIAEATDGDDAVAAFEAVETEEVAVDEATETTEVTEETADVVEEVVAEEATEATEETTEVAEDAVVEEATEVATEEVAEATEEETDDKQN